MNSCNKLIIELERSRVYYFKMLSNPLFSGFDIKKSIKNELTELKRELDGHQITNFVYFLTSRKKVRININKSGYHLFSKHEYKLVLEIGKDRKEHIVKNIRFVKMCENSKPTIELTQNTIRIVYSEDCSQSFNIYDFLNIHKYNLDIHTEVHYVGHTNNPQDRPVELNHTGLSKVLLNISNDENDFFVYYNTFNIYAVLKQFYVIKNPKIFEKNNTNEFIQNIFINYFNSSLQVADRVREDGMLRNQIKYLKQNFFINNISCYFEVDKETDYFSFYHNNIHDFRHKFTIQLNKSKLEIIKE